MAIMRRGVDYYAWLFREKMWYLFGRVLYRLLPFSEFIDFVYEQAVAENRDQGIYPPRPNLAELGKRHLVLNDEQSAFVKRALDPQDPFGKRTRHTPSPMKRVSLINSITTPWFYLSQEDKTWIECSAAEAALLFVHGIKISLGVPTDA